MRKNDLGITLIGLVVTIIVLLILAGVSIAMLTGDSGLITKANEAKIETAIGTIKEEISVEMAGYKLEKERDMLLEDLYAEGKVRRSVRKEGEDYYLSYVMEGDKWQGTSDLGKGNPADRKDIFLIDENYNIKYIASNGKEYGDDVTETLLEDETIVRFRSPEFAEYIKLKSGASSIDNIKFQWMKTQTELTINDATITSLEDLVFFPNLKELTIGGYGAGTVPQITNLKGIENCTQLTKLSIINGPNKDYKELQYLQNLETFSKTGGNDYKEIIKYLKFCSNLKSLNLTNLKIDNMKNICEFYNLTSLNLGANNIQKIEGLDNLVNLKNLTLANNNITKIEGIDRLQNLETLDLSGNNLIDILELDKNNKLKTLNLLNNPNIKHPRSEYTEEEQKRLDKIQEIMTIREGNININVEQLNLFNGYKYIELSNRKDIITLELLEGQTLVERLSLHGTKVTLEDEMSKRILTSMKNLKNISLSYTEVKTLEPLNNLTKLEHLQIMGIKDVLDLSKIEDIISRITIQGAKQADIDTLSNCNPQKITSITLFSSDFTKFPDLSCLVELSNLSITDNASATKPIIDLTNISKLNMLETLAITNIDLSKNMIDLSNLTNLQNLNLQNNYINSEGLGKLTVLKNNENLTLDLRNNSIIDATALLQFEPSKIKKIYLTGNVNLNETSKTELSKKFGNKVVF